MQSEYGMEPHADEFRAKNVFKVMMVAAKHLATYLQPQDTSKYGLCDVRRVLRVLRVSRCETVAILDYD